MLQPKIYINNLDNMDFPFKARLLHFEARYQSINDLLEGLSINNVLELSSGFSFRGLDLIQKKEVNYIDTDLPEVIELKKQFIEALNSPNFKPLGNLKTLPLNALDEQQFNETVKLFPPGEVAILTEGLLMYLNPEEKLKLFVIIHNILKQRCGYWIVADVYVRKDIDLRYAMVNDNLQGFYTAHNIEENKFESFVEAEKLFNEAGLVIDKTADNDYSKLSGYNDILGTADAENVSLVKSASEIRTTWRLKVAAQ